MKREEDTQQSTKSAELQDAAALLRAAKNLHTLEGLWGLGKMENEDYERAREEIKTAFARKREPDLSFLPNHVWDELLHSHSHKTGIFAWMFSDPPGISVDFFATSHEFRLGQPYWRVAFHAEDFLSRKGLLKVAYYLHNSHVDQVYLLRGTPDIYALWLNGVSEKLTSSKKLQVQVSEAYS